MLLLDKMATKLRIMSVDVEAMKEVEAEEIEEDIPEVELMMPLMVKTGEVKVQEDPEVEEEDQEEEQEVTAVEEAIELMTETISNRFITKAVTPMMIKKAAKTKLLKLNMNSWKMPLQSTKLPSREFAQ